MKKSLLASVSLGALALATGAQAADIAARPTYKAPAMAPAPWSWAGFYVGANVGVASTRSSASDDPAALPVVSLNGLTANANGTNVMGGVQAGYNWQIANAVVGVEADLSYIGQNRSSIPVQAIAGTDQLNSRLNGLGTVRARAGWAFDRLLVYGTGGVAFASIKDQVVNPAFPFTATSDTTRTGWAAGLGVEYAISGPWTVKVEYLHVELPNRSAAAFIGGAMTAYAFAFRDKIDIGRVGINYKF